MLFLVLELCGFSLHRTQVTLSHNSADGSGGGLFNGGTTNLTNTIIANSTGLDCVLNSGGINVKFNNLIEDGSCNPSLSGNPNLGILTNNGGATNTHALIAGSIAIDGGNNAETVGLLFDQRGSAFDRIVNGTVDIGAFEVQPTSVPESSSLIPLVIIALGGFSRRPKLKPNWLCSETLPKFTK